MDGTRAGGRGARINECDMNMSSNLKPSDLDTRIAIVAR